MSTPSIWTIDIETAPNTVYTWGTYNQFVSTKQIIKPGYILSFAAKKLGTKQVEYFSVWHSGKERMVERLWEILDDADGIIGYNSKNFDIKWINAALQEQGYAPPSPYEHIDLLLTMRREFKNPSNKLEYVLKKFKLDTKLETGGFGLWIGCMDGDPKSWATMKRYNKQDVKTTELLYHELLPWIKTHPNYGVFANAIVPMCKNCGSTDLTALDNLRYTKVATYAQHRCDNCGTINQERKRFTKPTDGILK